MATPAVTIASLAARAAGGRRRRLPDEVAAAELDQLQAGPDQAVGQPQAGPVVVPLAARKAA